jgi:hypothetical protein
LHSISPIFEHLLQKRTRDWLAKVEIGDKEYGMDVIVDFDIDNGIVSADDFEIGTVIVPKLVIRLKAFEKLPDNAKVVPYVALSLDQLVWDEVEDSWDVAEYPWAGGTTEWLPLGEYYIDQREQINNTWEYTCYGKLMLANAAYISSLSYPASMQGIWNEICEFMDYEYDESIIINSNYTVPIAPTGYSMRQVMGYIAGCHAASVYEGRNGTVKWKVYDADDEPVFELSTDNYVRLKQNNPIKTYTRFVGKYGDEETDVIEVGDGNENHTLSFENPFITTNIMNDLLDKLDGLSYMPATIDARSFPQLELGDMLGVYRDDSLPWVDTEEAWEDNDLPWNGLRKYVTYIQKQKLSFRGGLFMSLESHAHSEQQSEFKVDGSISAQIKRINETAMKLDKVYFGVSVSKEYGYRVDFSNGLGHSIWNAGEFKFVIEDESVFWLDVLNKKLKFAGDLDAASGTFSGTVSAGTIMGSSIFGSNFRTNFGSYPYVELSSDYNVFIAAKSAMSYIEIEANPSSYASPIIRHTDGTAMALTGLMSGDYFTLVSGGDYDIGATGGSVRVNGETSIQLSGGTIMLTSNTHVTSPNNLYVPGANRLYLGNMALSSILNGIYDRLDALENP